MCTKAKPKSPARMVKDVFKSELKERGDMTEEQTILPTIAGLRDAADNFAEVCNILRDYVCRDRTRNPLNIPGPEEIPNNLNTPEGHTFLAQNAWWRGIVEAWQASKQAETNGMLHSELTQANESHPLFYLVEGAIKWSGGLKGIFREASKGTDTKWFEQVRMDHLATRTLGDKTKCNADSQALYAFRVERGYAKKLKRNELKAKLDDLFGKVKQETKMVKHVQSLGPECFDQTVSTKARKLIEATEVHHHGIITALAHKVERTSLNDTSKTTSTSGPTTSTSPPRKRSLDESNDESEELAKDQGIAKLFKGLLPDFGETLCVLVMSGPLHDTKLLAHAGESTRSGLKVWTRYH